MVIGQPSLWSLVKHEVVVTLFGSLPGALGFFLRKLFYPPLFGASGRGVIWGRNLVIRHGHKIVLGDHVVIDDNVVLDAKGSDSSEITIGNRSMISRNSVLSCKNGKIAVGSDVSIGMNALVHAIEGSDVIIGDKTVIAAYVYLIGGGTYRTEMSDIPFKDQGTYAKGGVHIGPNVWIGAQSQILDGVVVNRGAIVAAGAVVNKSVEPASIVGGVPATLIKYRESTEQKA